jgi:tetratricopeptide (TPR) repeat protein
MPAPSAQQLVNQAMKLRQAGSYAQAEIVARQALAENRKNSDALAVLGLIAYDRGNYEDAASWHQKALALARKEPLYHCNLAITNVARGRLAAALDGFEKALKLRPGSPEALAGKADVLERRGNAARALATLEPAIRSGAVPPRIASVYTRILLRLGRDEEVVSFAGQQLERSEVQGIERRQILLLLGKAHERQGDVELAFDAFRRGNELETRPFSIDAVAERFDALMSVFSREAMATLPRASHGRETPVFIAGMPRSGTTLIEQIIHAHPKGCGIGEIREFGALLHGAHEVIGGIDPYPACVANMTQADVDRLADTHLAMIKRRGRGALRVADKTLDNFQHLGMVALLFPKARVIHSRRHPMDACFSCFFENLPPQAHPHASDLTHLGQYYRQYVRLMEHWRAVLDLRMLDVEYEALVADQETVTREIIAFLDLEWDDRCLSFHQAKRDVATLSYDQVRRPIYTSAVRRYERYAAHLTPLAEALGDVLEK